ncbi:MAG: hypothetical protein Kow0010_14620 [Dehalococcoidia bacterium]
MRIHNIRRLAVLGLFAVLAVSAFGFAAANTGPGTTQAGESDETISGYDISGVQYNLDPANPQQIESVTFTASPAIQATDNVFLQLDGNGWTDCGSLAGATVTCNLASNVNVLDATNFQLIITQ